LTVQRQVLLVDAVQVPGNLRRSAALEGPPWVPTIGLRGDRVVVACCLLSLSISLSLSLALSLSLSVPISNLSLARTLRRAASAAASAAAAAAAASAAASAGLSLVSPPAHLPFALAHTSLALHVGVPHAQNEDKIDVV
jgi:hypothetical protein